MPESPPVTSATLSVSLPAPRYSGAWYSGCGSIFDSIPGLGCDCLGNGGFGCSCFFMAADNCNPKATATSAERGKRASAGARIHEPRFPVVRGAPRLAAALPSAGGLGGPFEAPHLN